MWKDWFLLKREKGNLRLHIFRSWYVVPSFGKMSTNLLQPSLQCNLHVRCCLEHQGCILITILSFYLPHCCQCLWTKADLPKLSFADNKAFKLLSPIAYENQIWRLIIFLQILHAHQLFLGELLCSNTFLNIVFIFCLAWNCGNGVFSIELLR